MKKPVVSLIFWVIFLINSEIFAADINIDISESTIIGNGSDIHYSTDEELERFNVTLENWARFVKSHNPIQFENRGKPKQIYYRNPTPYGDIFNDLSADVSDGSELIPPTVTKISFLSYKVLENSTVREVLTTEDCSNGQIRNVVNNMIHSEWSSKLGFPVDAKIGLKVNISESSISITSNFDQQQDSSESLITEMNTGISDNAMVCSGQTAKASLSAERVTLKVAIDYTATISGFAILYYTNFQYSTIPISKLLRFLSGNRDNDLRATQIVDIEIYINPKIENVDRKAN